MCGICGIIDWDDRGESRAAEKDVTAMIERLAHRGPDGWGVAHRGPAALGAARLAIRGLPDGQQPVVDEDSGVMAVCNGEIDNHHELKRWLAERGRPVSASTDIAVIPGLYLELGPEFIERLIGAFAVAVWSPREQLVLLGRDRAGERPLYYAARDSEVRFASEVAALAAPEREGLYEARTAHPAGDLSRAGDAAGSYTVDVDAARAYLQAGYFPAPTSPFAEIRKVGPGERIELFPGGVRRHVRYWRWGDTRQDARYSEEPSDEESLPGSDSLRGEIPRSHAPSRANPARAGDPVFARNDAEKPSPRQTPNAPAPPNAVGARRASKEERSDEFDAVFREAVRRQSDVDVPYGLFLSGGVDSSLVAAVARKLRPEHKLRGYTLRFAEESYDESGFAQRVADLLGVELCLVDVTPELFPDSIAQLVASAGEPLADPAWVPTALLARRAAQDVKIALVGEGADELFGGYPTYIGAEIHRWYARLPAAMRGLLRWAVERWPASDKKVTLSFLAKRFVQGADLEGAARHLLWTSSISPALLERLGVAPADARRVERPANKPLLNLLQRIDLENSLAEGLLTKADRASMKFAIELRAPFLDVDVMEFAAGLPAAERVRGVTTKVFLKRYARRYLPASIVDRRKRGLSVPLARWLRDPLYDWARAHLGSGALAECGVRVPAALELLEEHRHRKADHARALWTLLVLNEWLVWAAQNAHAAGARADATPSRPADSAPLAAPSESRGAAV